MIMKTRTQMLADAVRSGVRGLFGIAAPPLSDSDASVNCRH